MPKATANVDSVYGCPFLRPGQRQNQFLIDDTSNPICCRRKKEEYFIAEAFVKVQLAEEFI